MLVDQRCEKINMGVLGQFKQVMLASVSALQIINKAVKWW